MTMLEKAAQAAATIAVGVDEWGEDVFAGPLVSQAIARAVLEAVRVRSQDDEFMLGLYPNPHDAPSGIKSGERSRRYGVVQINHWINHILTEQEATG